MVYEIIEIELRLYHVFSIKDRRAIIRPLTERIRNRLNFSVMEEAPELPYDHTKLYCALVAADQRHLDQQLQSLRDLIDSYHRVEMIRFEPTE